MGRSRVTLVAVVFAANLSAQTADDRYPFVRDGKLGFIDASGKEVIPAQFQPIGDFAHFSEGLAPVDGPEGSGYIDPIPRQFTNADHFWHGLARVVWNDGYGYLDKTGRTVWRVRR